MVRAVGYSDGVDFIQGRRHMGGAMASSVVTKVKEQAGNGPREPGKPRGTGQTEG